MRVYNESTRIVLSGSDLVELYRGNRVQDGGIVVEAANGASDILFIEVASCAVEER